MLSLYNIYNENYGGKGGHGEKKLTKIERDMIKLPPYQYSVIIGIMLSDGSLSFSSPPVPPSEAA